MAVVQSSLSVLYCQNKSQKEVLVALRKIRLQVKWLTYVINAVILKLLWYIRSLSLSLWLMFMTITITCVVLCVYLDIWVRNTRRQWNISNNVFRKRIYRYIVYTSRCHFWGTGLRDRCFRILLLLLAMPYVLCRWTKNLILLI